MEERFDFNRMGKRMPYTAPEGFLTEIEKNVWEIVKSEVMPKSKHNYRLLYTVLGGVIAASLAILIVFSLISDSPDTSDFAKIEQAFSDLSSMDQAYLLTVFQNDLFINE